MGVVFGIVKSQDNKNLTCNLNKKLQIVKNNNFNLLIKYLMIVSEPDRIIAFLVIKYML